MSNPKGFLKCINIGSEVIAMVSGGSPIAGCCLKGFNGWKSKFVWKRTIQK